MNTNREERAAFQECVMCAGIVGVGKVERDWLCGELECKSVKKKFLDSSVAVLHNPWFNYLLIVLVLVTRQN